MHDNEQIDRKDDGSDRLAALYGLTPKVETAIIDAVQAGAVRRLRTLVAPLHPADQADLLEPPSRSFGTHASADSSVTRKVSWRSS